MKISEICRKGVGMDRWGSPPSDEEQEKLYVQWRIAEGLPASREDFDKCPHATILAWAERSFRIRSRFKFLECMQCFHLNWESTKHNLRTDASMHSSYYKALIAQSGGRLPEWSVDSFTYQLRQAAILVMKDELDGPYWKQKREHWRNKETAIEDTEVVRRKIGNEWKLWALISALPFIFFVFLHDVPVVNWLYVLLMSVTALNTDPSLDIWRMAAWAVWPCLALTVGWCVSLQWKGIEYAMWLLKNERLIEANSELQAVEYVFYGTMFLFWLPTLLFGWLVYMSVLVVLGVIFVLSMSVSNAVKGKGK